MTTKTKKQTVKSNAWVLKNKETGKVYSNWSYPSRTAARQAAKGRRFKGMYVPARSGDGGIDPKKLKPKAPVPMPKSIVVTPIEVLSRYEAFMEWLFNEDSEEVVPTTTPIQTESNTLTKVRPTTNSKPKLRKASSAVGSKFHRHGTFGVK